MGFENLSKDKGVITSQILHSNAKALFTTADKAAEIGNYGIARSLMILGSEEFIKGCILYLWGVGVKVYEVKEVGKALRNHKERHEVAMLFKLFKIIEGFVNFRKYKGSSDKEVSWFDSIPHYLKEVQSFLKVMVDVGEDLSWWEKANGYKNAGFYVDYIDGIHKPSSVTIEDFKLASDKVKGLTKRFRVIKLILERGASEQDISDLVEMINKGLQMKALKS